MLVKFYNLLVGLLMLQLSHCHPFKEAANATDLEMRFQALKMFKNLEVEKIMNYTVEQRGQIFQRILQKAVLLHPQSDLLKEHLEKLSTFVQDVELLREMEPSDLKSSGIRFFASHGTDVSTGFEADATAAPGDFPRQLLPNENGQNELKEGANLRLRAFVEKFTLMLGDLVAGMTSQERLMQKEAVHWYETYGGEDLDKRVAHFFQYTINGL